MFLAKIYLIDDRSNAQLIESDLFGTLEVGLLFIIAKNVSEKAIIKNAIVKHAIVKHAIVKNAIVQKAIVKKAIV